MNYDEIAPTYHQRYASNPMEDVGRELSRLAASLPARRILEAGCGTGRWLVELSQPGRQVFGLDASIGMLRQAQERGMGNLVHGEAAHLPLAAASLEMAFCVYAFHHFHDRHAFLAEAHRLLAPGGVLAILGMDPHAPGNDMYIYHYFDGVRETDLKRFAPQQTILNWMAQAGFKDLRVEPISRIRDRHSGAEVWNDPFLEKKSTSQLALLNEESYQAGLERMRAAIRRAAERGDPIDFNTDLTIFMIMGRVTL